jgi:pimeloyl-ACP methyl ester carboxylesterase
MLGKIKTKRSSFVQLIISISIFISFVSLFILIWRCSNKSNITTTRSIQVEPEVKLEVINWGGGGIPLIFLAGLGHTAHVFDEFAPQLTDKYYVFGITRRGFGESSQPDSGYSLSTLVEDIHNVIDSLGVGKVVVVGHSLGGDEMTLLAKKYPEDVRALIYIEAAYNRVSARDSLFRYQVPETPIPKPSKMDSSSAEAYRDYYARVNGVTMPLSEIKTMYSWTTDGRFNGSKTPGRIYGQITGSLRDPDYSGINIPALAIYATQYAVTELFIDYYTCDSTTQQAMRIYHEAALRIDKLSRDYFRIRMIQGRVVEVKGAGHSLYITHAEETLSAIRTFLYEVLYLPLRNM